MLAITRGYGVGSGLIMFLQSELERLDWNQQRLAEESTISPGAISKLFTKPSTVPTLTTLKKLSHALKQPLIKLVAVAGFDPGEYAGHPQAEQVALLLEAVPDLAELHDTVVELPPDDLLAVLGYAQGRKRKP